MRASVFLALIVLSAAAKANDDLSRTLYISAAGMKVQSDRMRVVAENIANADSTADNPLQDPYRRKTIFFENKYDPELNINKIVVKKISRDPSPFEMRYDPWHPAADQDGYVKRPNVNPMVEAVDSKEAQRTYEANLSAIEVTKSMLSKTIDIMR